MATNWAAVDVQCPFYRENDGRNVRCEGVWRGTGIATTFRSPEARKKHMERFCMDCYTRCLLYGPIERKYEE